MAGQLNGRSLRPSLSDIERSVAKVKVKEREIQKPSVDDLRETARMEVAEIKVTSLVKFQDIQDSLKAAQEKAKEQVRKLADEAKDAKERTRRERP